ncbi:unnamed protein product, partial [Leptidea sinapis]
MMAEIVKKAEFAESRLVDFRSKVEQIRGYKVEEKIKDLIKENDLLASKVEKAKSELIRLETLNGKKQYNLSDISVKTGSKPDIATAQKTSEIEPPLAKRDKKEKEPKKVEKASGNVTKTDSIIDVRKLDLRIGKIVDINKHPDADSLYVEKIDCGEENPRIVVSGLVNHVPIDEMKNKIVMVLCNLKPVKMRGVTSEAMVMCASSPEKVEVLVPPCEAAPGDLVCCEGYPREPEPQMNPKKKIFETCAPDLKTNENRVACYKGSPLIIPGKGPIVAPTLTCLQLLEMDESINLEKLAKFELKANDYK